MHLRRLIPALVAIFALSIGSASAAIVTAGLIQNLDAGSGVVESGGAGTGVTSWANSAASGGDDLVTDRGTIGLTTGGAFDYLTLGGGGPPRMVGDDAAAFDSIMNGNGHTWFAVVRPEVDQNGGQKNAIFGTLTNSNPFSGVVAHVSNNANAGYMTRPAGSDVFANGTTNVNDGGWHILVGRLDSGTTLPLAEVFTNGPVAEGTANPGILATTNSDAFTLGAERIGGGENYLGDIAQILIYDRPLSDPELNQTGFALGQAFGIPNAFVPEPSAAALFGLGMLLIFRRRRR